MVNNYGKQSIYQSYQILNSVNMKFRERILYG